MIKTIKKIFLYFILPLLIAYSTNVYGQYTNELTPQYYAYAQARNSLIEQNRQLPCVDKTLSIAVYIVRDSLGNPNILESNIHIAIDSLNELFSPICLSFNICSIEYINNYQWDTLTVNDDNGKHEEEQMVTTYHKDSTINLYFIKAFKNLPGEYGLSAYPGGCDNIIIEKDHVNDKTIPHQFGRFFGLLPTFGMGNSQELVDGSNCETTGDFLCDTEADPQNSPYFSLSTTSNCELANPQTDNNNQFYLPPTDNIMSFYRNCRVRFTKQQYRIMAFEYLNNRNYLW